jgi:hypothetical protein
MRGRSLCRRALRIIAKKLGYARLNNGDVLFAVGSRDANKPHDCSECEMPINSLEIMIETCRDFMVSVPHGSSDILRQSFKNEPLV